MGVMIDRAHLRWSKKEFGDADLGDRRRTARLVAIGAQVAAQPAGRITQVFSDAAGREGTYRFVENDGVDADAIAQAVRRSTALRAQRHSHVFVPIDQTSLTLTDDTGRKDFGAVSRHHEGVRGLILMSGLAVEPSGVPIGPCGQVWWTRKEPVRIRKNDRRRTDEKETQRWCDVMRQASETFAKEAPLTRPWFQMDRGADAWPILLEAVQQGYWATVRAAHNRRLAGEVGGKRKYLWPHLARQQPAGWYVLDVPGGSHRRERRALMQLQYSPVVLDAIDLRTSRRHAIPLFAVRVVEVDTTPLGETPIEWLLLTTRPVNGIEDAKEVVIGYAARWRIEELHRVWKNGGCRVEDSQLQKSAHVERWATILMAVAARITRLTYLARQEPDAPATCELSCAEIDAIIMLKKPPGVARGATPTIGEAIRWIADLGGYVGPKASGGPPGATVIGRGLARIEPVAQVLGDGAL